MRVIDWFLGQVLQPVPMQPTVNIALAEAIQVEALYSARSDRQAISRALVARDDASLDELLAEIACLKARQQDAAE